MTLNLSDVSQNIARAIEMADRIGVKFTPEHVRGVTWLREAAEDYIRSYSGSFDYMLKLRDALARYKKLGFDNQVSGALNCLMVEVRRERQLVAEREAEANSLLHKQIDFGEVDDDIGLRKQVYLDSRVQGGNERSNLPSVGKMIAPPAGYYTVAFEDGTHSTIRVRRIKSSDYTRFAYLSGSDNEHDYTNFAYMRANGRVSRISGVEKPSRAWEAVMILVGARTDEITAYGKAYAMASGNCYNCGRTLTDPESVAAGLGPICRGAK